MMSALKGWRMAHPLFPVSLLFFVGSVVEALTVTSTVLVIAKDSTTAKVATAPMTGYGIPYEILAVPQPGVITLPTLNSTATDANYGLIVVISAVAYDYGTDGGWHSALTAEQWTTIRDFQKAFAVRMVHLDVYPGPDYGSTALGGCCTGTIQQARLSNSTAFPTAGLKTGATISMEGLWHYPASVADTNTTTPFLQFDPVPEFPTDSVGGVINQFTDGREQMAFFTSFGTWSLTSYYLSHIWIQWGTRGIYPGFRRIKLLAQVDDVMLATAVYDKNGTTFRIRPSDLDAHKTWTTHINSRMNPGSDFFIELAYNGNGNLEAASNNDTTGNICSPFVEYEELPGTSLEFQKQLNTSVNVWPADVKSYTWTDKCTNLDAVRKWLGTAANRDAFAHVSHTFTHLSLNNATYSDCSKEISYNQAWMKQTGITSAARFSGTGLIPPAITGLHNGDCLQAWWDNGLRNAVGDNTRPPLRNQINDYWPLTTTVAANGFDGYSITPRFASNIYYNCDLPACTVAEWMKTASGQGDIYKLLELEKTTNTRNILSLRQDPYMFHQANLRVADVDPMTINGKSAQLSLLQMWVETVVQELTRLVDWPIVTDKHDDINKAFQDREKRDACAAKLRLNLDDSTRKITGVEVLTNNNACPAKIPVTVPNTVTNTQGFTTEQRGSDPLTIWVDMKGSPVSFTFGTPLTPVKPNSISSSATSSGLITSTKLASISPILSPTKLVVMSISSSKVSSTSTTAAGKAKETKETKVKNKDKNNKDD